MNGRKRLLRIIALIEAAGGVVGAVIVFVVAPKLASQAHVPLGSLLPWFVLPFGLSLTAGGLLWRGGTAGEVLSLINLGLQVPVIGTPFLSYFFNCGIALRIWVGSDGPGWYLFLGSQFHINFAPSASGVLIGVNVVALMLLALLIYAIPDDKANVEKSRALAHSA